MKKLLIISLFFGAGLFSVEAVHAAPFMYGSFSFKAPSTAIIKYKTLDLQKEFSCDTRTFSCAASGSSTTPILPDALKDRDVIRSVQGTLALAREKLTDGSYQSTLYDISLGEAVLRATLPINVRITSFHSNALNTRLVFVTTKELLVYDVTKNEVVRNIAIEDEDRFAAPHLSPQGKYFAYYTSGSVSKPERNHNIVNLDTGTTYRLKEKITYWDLLSEANELFQFSPDDKSLIYLDDYQGAQTLYQVDLAKLSGKKFLGKRVITRNYGVIDFLWTSTGKFFFVGNRDATYAWGLYELDIPTKTVTKIDPNASYGLGIVERDGKILFSRIVPTGSEIVAYDLTEKKLKTFESARPASTGPGIVKGETVTLGGISGSLFKPDHYDKKKAYPLIIWLHGGPYRQASAEYHAYGSYGMYDWMFDNLRKSGVMILQLDYRGSFGYGRKFADGLKNQIGLQDVADVLKARTALAAKTKIGPTYLMGVSYGGYLALRTIVEQPKVFAGAISIAGVMDWADLTYFENAIFAVHFGGPDSKETGRSYDKSSIISRLGNLTTQKIVVVHGDKDGTIPVKEAYKIENAFKIFGKPVEMVIYPGEDHVLKYRKTLRSLCEKTFSVLGVSGSESCAAAEGDY